MARLQNQAVSNNANNSCNIPQVKTINKESSQEKLAETPKHSNIASIGNISNIQETSNAHNQNIPTPSRSNGNIGKLTYTQALTNANKRDESEHGRSKNEDFQMVTYRKKKKETIIGTGKLNSDIEFQAAETNIWVYVGRVGPNVTEDHVIKYIKNKTKEDEKITCEELKTIGSNKAFKVGVSHIYKDQMYEPTFWPTGTIIRRFNLNLFRNKQTANKQWKQTTNTEEKQ